MWLNFLSWPTKWILLKFSSQIEDQENIYIFIGCVNSFLKIWKSQKNRGSEPVVFLVAPALEKRPAPNRALKNHIFLLSSNFPQHFVDISSQTLQISQAISLTKLKRRIRVIKFFSPFKSPKRNLQGKNYYDALKFDHKSTLKVEISKEIKKYIAEN